MHERVFHVNDYDITITIDSQVHRFDATHGSTTKLSSSGYTIILFGTRGKKQLRQLPPPSGPCK